MANCGNNKACGGEADDELMTRSELLAIAEFDELAIAVSEEPAAAPTAESEETSNGSSVAGTLEELMAAVVAKTCELVNVAEFEELASYFDELATSELAAGYELAKATPTASKKPLVAAGSGGLVTATVTCSRELLTTAA